MPSLYDFRLTYIYLDNLVVILETFYYRIAMTLWAFGSYAMLLGLHLECPNLLAVDYLLKGHYSNKHYFAYT